MAAQISSPNLSTRTRGRTVATYRDLRGAALALERLESSGVDVRDVTVRPVGLDVDDVVLTRLADRDRLLRRWCTSTAVLVGTVTVVVLGVRPLSLLAAGAAAGAAALAAVGAVRLRRAAVRRRIQRAATVVRARAFDLVVERDAWQVEHELARWWDPEAPPGAAG